MDPDSIARIATGAANVITDRDGRVLLVHHTYGHSNWELPGGLGEADETPAENAARELREETGLVAGRLTLTGVYYERHHRFAGPLLHFVFRTELVDDRDPIPDLEEISEAAYWPLDALPVPMSDFTERRIRDALAGGPVVIGRVDGRTWRE
jgi:8-oxo-dGTP pyrophosphatase MutT (NUDIX family)